MSLHLTMNKINVTLNLVLTVTKFWKVSPWIFRDTAAMYKLVLSCKSYSQLRFCQYSQLPMFKLLQVWVVQQLNDVNILKQNKRPYLTCPDVWHGKVLLVSAWTMMTWKELIKMHKEGQWWHSWAKYEEETRFWCTW